MNILSIVLLFIPIVILNICGYKFRFHFNGIVYIGMFFYLIVHELLHALGFSFFVKDKKNIKIGITLEKGVFYAICQELINKKGIIVSLLFPLIFLSIIPFPIALIFHADWLIFYSIINFAGTIGDILILILVLKMPKNIEYIDYDNSVGLYFVSKSDISNINLLGFKLESFGDIKDKKVDKSIKTFYISKPSMIILGILVLLLILLIIL